MREFEVEVRCDVMAVKLVRVQASSPEEAMKRATNNPGLAGWANMEDPNPRTPGWVLCRESVEGAYVDLQANPGAVQG